ncbi:hypothetical protein B0H10DRAFT_2124798, partial [Mycena sp. CBHHK59/15]
RFTPKMQFSLFTTLIAVAIMATSVAATPSTNPELLEKRLPLCDACCNGKLNTCCLHCL